MGNSKVFIRDLGSVNFDKVCRLALELQFVRQANLDAIEVVVGTPVGPNDFDIEGDDRDREYWKAGGRSMTEMYAIRAGLGVTDDSDVVCVDSPVAGLEGLSALCRALAENHGKVPGVKGGSLYKRGMVPTYAKSLVLLPERASEILGKLVKLVVMILKDKHPIPAMIAATGSEWDEIDDAVSAAERAVYSEARETARMLHEGRFANGTTFRLEKAKDSQQGVTIATRNPNLMKHLWAAMKAMEPAFKVAVAVVSHPETGRIAILCSQGHPVDIRPVAKALAKRFPDAEFDVNVERNSVVWDPRSGTPGPAVATVQEIVSSQIAFREREKAARGPSLGATLGDIMKHKVVQRR